MVKVKIYTKDNCPYCIKAKLLFKKYKVNFDEIQIKNQEEQDNLIEITGWMTVPQIFINDKFIGGCDDLYKLEEEGKLKSIFSS